MKYHNVLESVLISYFTVTQDIVYIYCNTSEQEYYILQIIGFLGFSFTHTA